MKITWLLVFAAVIIFVYTFFFAPDIGKFYEFYGFSGENLLARPYVLVTSIFLHGSLVHLLANALVWIFFGLAVEDELGKGRMLVIFFLGAFAGDLLSLLFYPFGTVAIGASAGIFALVGTGMLVRPLDLSFYPLVVPLPLAFIGIAYALFNVYGFIFNIDPEISYIGHFGGLAVGLIFGIRHKGMKQSLKIILITLAIMILIPLVWFLLMS
jgi:hypothetical protein